MSRQKKPRLKRRKDGRYKAVYHGMQFMGDTEDEALAARQAFIDAEKDQIKVGVTVKSYGLAWLPRTHPKAVTSHATYVELAIHLEKLIRQIGGKLLLDVVPSDIKEVYSREYAGLSNSYIKAGKQLFCAMFDAAVADGYCRYNPARSKSAAPHKGRTGGHRAITEQERDWILHLCQDHRAHAAVMTMLYAGLRPQEMKALKIDRDVDLVSETITLREFAHIKDNNHYQFSSEGKTDKATRTIPLFPPLKAALAGKTGYLIQTADGKRVTIQSWRSAWESYVSCMETAINGCPKRWYGKTREHKKILAAGGKLQPWISFTVTPYDLRHSFCTMCRDHSVEIKTCMYWMGHTDVKMILKVYDAISEDRLRNEARKLSRKLIKVQNKVQTSGKSSGSLDT